MERCDPKKLNDSSYDSLCWYVTNTSTCSFDSGFLNYFQWQYCGFDNRVAPTILMFLWFIVLLMFIAVTADSFFAPCLVVVTKILRMSQNLAGVTLLALGNGAADVFSSLSAVMSSSDPNIGLALGSILGAGILVNTVTAGIIMIIRPFDVMRRPILKDLSFYLIAILWCMSILIRKKIELWSSIVFLIIYLIYVLVTGISRAIYVKNKKSNIVKENKDENFDDAIGINGEYEVDRNIIIENTTYSRENLGFSLSENITVTKYDHETDPHLDPGIAIMRRHGGPFDHNKDHGIHSLSSSTRSTIHRTMGSFAKMIMEKEFQKDLRIKNAKVLESTMERRRANSLDLNEGQVSPKTRFNSLNESVSHSTNIHNPTKHVVFQNLFHEKPNNISEDHESRSSIQISVTQSSDSYLNNNLESHKTDKNDLVVFPGLLKHFLLTILPIQLEDWPEQTLCSKVSTIIQSPFMFILTLTIPVIDDGAYARGWCKILNCLHCVTSPLIWITFTNVYQVKLGNSEFLLVYLVLIIGILVGVVVALTSKSDIAPKYFSLFAFIGFLTSIFWIYEIANEIVNILETLGIVLSIPQTILGLSVLAFANSIGDLVSNIMLAKNNYPKIGYAACIGGPLFNLLVGIGLPFTIATASLGPISIKLESETVVLITTVLLITLMNIIALPVMKFQLKSVYGTILIVIYVVFFVLVMLFATRVINVNV